MKMGALDFVRNRPTWTTHRHDQKAQANKMVILEHKMEEKTEDHHQYQGVVMGLAVIC